MNILIKTKLETSPVRLDQVLNPSQSPRRSSSLPIASACRGRIGPLALTLGQEDETLDQALHYARRDLTLRHTSESYAVLGWILSRLGRTSEAWMWIEAAQAWVQPEPEVDYLSGLVALDAGRPDRGKELLSRALAAEAEIGPIKSERIRRFLGSVD